MATLKETVRIVNEKGLHARASNKFARLVGTFQSEVRVFNQGEMANGESIMDLLMLVAHRGSDIDIEVVGVDAETALSALVKLVENGFGELDKE